MKITVDEHCEFITVQPLVESEAVRLPIVSAEALTREVRPYRGPDGAVWRKVEPPGAMVIHAENGRCFYRETEGMEWEEL